MTADRFSTINDDDSDGPSRLRQGVTILFVLLFTIFLFEAMDGVQRAAEQAERRENALRSACRSPVWDVEADPDDDHLPPEVATTLASAPTSVLTATAAHPPTTSPVPAPASPTQLTPDDPARP